MLRVYQSSRDGRLGEGITPPASPFTCHFSPHYSLASYLIPVTPPSLILTSLSFPARRSSFSFFFSQSAGVTLSSIFLFFILFSLSLLIYLCIPVCLYVCLSIILWCLASVCLSLNLCLSSMSLHIFFLLIQLLKFLFLFHLLFNTFLPLPIFLVYRLLLRLSPPLFLPIGCPFILSPSPILLLFFSPLVLPSRISSSFFFLLRLLPYPSLVSTHAILLIPPSFFPSPPFISSLLSFLSAYTARGSPPPPRWRRAGQVRNDVNHASFRSLN